MNFLTTTEELCTTQSLILRAPGKCGKNQEQHCNLAGCYQQLVCMLPIKMPNCDSVVMSL